MGGLAMLEPRLDGPETKGDVCWTHSGSRRKRDPMPLYRLTVNGQPREATADADTPLLYVLRNDFELNGPKFGCGLGQCGSCTVLLDGQALRSCQMPVSQVGDKPVTTLDGLGAPDALHPLQKAFIDEQAMQCGYCINGMIMTAKALLDSNPEAGGPEIRAALEGNLCRCGSHNRIMRAIERAAREMAR
jgi:nicotinate dehydrogenase subunit A